ncbi:MAG: substrate-binding domain-containing protein [Chloroflexi bacterium]|nr:substrate-binding domain-containing protein [Chloroflexota bacterium]
MDTALQPEIFNLQSAVLTLSRRRLLLSALACASSTIALGTVGCAARPAPRSSAPSDQAGPPRDSGELVLYSPEGQDFLARLSASFTSATGIAASVPPIGGPGAVFGALREDQRVGNVVADLAYGGGPFAFVLLERHELLAEADGAGDERLWPSAIPAHWQAVDLLAFTFAGRGLPPTELASLRALPARDVALVLPDPGRWDYGTMLVVAVLDWFRALAGDFERGWDYWVEVQRGQLHLASSLAGLGEALGRSERAVALVPRHLGVALAARLPDLWLRWPDEVPVLPNFAAQTRDAPHPERAARFLAWLSSAAAEEAILSAGRLPAHCAHGLEACAAGRALEGRAIPLDLTWGFSKYNEVRREWQRRFGKT